MPLLIHLSFVSPSVATVPCVHTRSSNNCLWGIASARQQRRKRARPGITDGLSQLRLRLSILYGIVYTVKKTIKAPRTNLLNVTIAIAVLILKALTQMTSRPDGCQWFLPDFSHCLFPLYLLDSSIWLLRQPNAVHKTTLRSIVHALLEEGRKYNFILVLIPIGMILLIILFAYFPSLPPGCIRKTTFALFLSYFSAHFSQLRRHTAFTRICFDRFSV